MVRKIHLSEKSLGKLISPYKVKIIKVLQEKKKLNYAELQRELKISARETRRHANKLYRAGVLSKTKKPRERGSPVFLSLKKRKKK